MRFPMRFTVLVIVSMFVAAHATVAFAAPVPWRTVDVRLHSDQSGDVMLVSGTLPDGTKLPAEAELSVPAGSAVQWIGEILGGSAADDPALKYTKTTEGAVDVYRFTLTKALTGQAEFASTGTTILDGTAHKVAIAWTSARDVPEVSLSVRVPTGAGILDPVADASMHEGGPGYGYYLKTFKKVKAGDALDLKFSYSAPAASTAAPVAGAAQGSDLVTPLLLGLLVIAVAALCVVALRRKPVAVASADDGVEAFDDEDDEPEDAPVAAEVVQGPSDDAPVAPERGKSGRTRRRLVTAVFLIVMVVVVALIGREAAKPRLVGDAITQVFEGGEPCATANIPLALAAGADPADAAQTLFAALKAMKGINTATFNVKTSTIAVGYCESKTTEQAVRAGLVPTALVAD